MNVVATKIVDVTNFGVARKIVGTEFSEDIFWRDVNISLVSVKEQ